LNRCVIRSAASGRSADRWRCACAALASSLAACASYEPRALVPEEEIAALRAARIENVRIEHARPGAGGAPRDFVFDASDGLDERELVAVALTLNPRLRAKRIEIGGPEALLAAAGVWPNPELDLSVRSVISGASATGVAFDLLFELFRPGERRAQRAVAEARLDAARAEVAAAEIELATAVRHARLRVLASEEVARFAQRESGLRARALELVRERRDLGEATEIAVAMAELESAHAARELRGAHASADAERRALNALIGLPPDREIRLAESGRSLSFTLYGDVDDAELDRRLITGRLDLRARAAAYRQAEEELRLAVARSRPRLRIGPSYEKDVEGNSSLGVAASVPLAIFDRNQGEIGEKTAARDRARAEYSATLADARARAFAARAELARTRREVELAEVELAPLVDRSDALVEGALRARELSIFEWLAAQSRSVEARREMLDGLVRYASAVIELEAATGMSLAKPVEENRLDEHRRP
jgi:outer membrane protein TolC